MSKRYYIGRAICCGAISAGMVDDELTSADDVVRFAKSIGKTNRRLEHLEIPDDQFIQLARCKCSSNAKAP